MDDKLFDKQIKAALEHLDAPYDAASWALLESRLNAPFIEEQPVAVDAVDKAVFRTLERLEVPYRAAHWDVFTQRMTQVVRQRRRIWVTKLSEAAIFLLLLVNLKGLHETGTLNPQQPGLPQPPANNRLQAQIPTSQGHRGGSGTPGSLSEDTNLNNGGFWAETTPYLLHDPNIQNFTEFIVSNPQREANGIVPEHEIDPGSESLFSLASLTALSILPGEPVERVNASPYALSTVTVKAPKQHRFYAETFASFDQNYVRSDGYSNTSKGFGGGVGIGYRIGKWGVETGLSYNRRQYQPKKEVEIYDITPNGLYGSYAKSVDADIVSVPVKITRRIAQFGQTTAHATAGVTTNFALDKNYQYESVYYPSPSASGSNSPDQQPKLRKNGQGVLENGSLHGNVYASADVGMRLEQPIGRHIAAFVEPAYRLALGKKGIGPNPAKVNTFSLQAGVLATM